ncbi:MAG: hypothetical protein IT181_17050 [Acidobacteria bacterium]|nr:hypothetical protein [Acidobacteriota bacterium]
MTTDERALYREALAKARNTFGTASIQLAELAGQQRRLAEEIANLRKTITAISALCSEEPGLDKLGITDAVLEAMNDVAYSYTTGEVVSQLEAMGFDLASQKNAAASVHAVLDRLAKRGKLTRVKHAKRNENGAPWEWRGPKYDADKDIEAGYSYKPGEIPVPDDDVPF